MPATVRRVAVKVGDTVTRGDTSYSVPLKMEPGPRARDGKIRVHCHEGELVLPGLVLIEIGEA